jgi:hypothetical protein
VSTPAPARTLRRRFTLGSGPLKRTSDRVEFASRVVLLVALVLAAPVGLLAGAAGYTSLQATAEQEADTRFPVTATLLADAARPEAGGADAPAEAFWTAPDGSTPSGQVDAPAGARAGDAVAIWVDASGRVTPEPLPSGEVVVQAVVIGFLAALFLVITGMAGHLVVVWQLDRRRARRWADGWSSVAPVWASRFR